MSGIPSKLFNSVFRMGNLSAALDCYRLAIRKDQNVEQKYRKALQSSTLLPIETQEPSEYYTYYNFGDDQKQDPLQSMNALVNSFSELELEFKESLLETLPSELLLHILKWYLYSDMAHLINLRLVCRKMFLLTHEKSLWRLLCEMIHVNDSPMALFEECAQKHDGDWFALFLKKPRIKYHGVYISRVNYLRQGYNETYNQPIHMVSSE
jgi:hypothetical protein